MTAPLPGDYGLVATYGNWHDALVGRLIRWDTDSPVNHAFVFVGDGEIVEATPAGAKVSPVTDYDNVTWSTGSVALTDTQRRSIVTAARSDAAAHIGYGWLDIVAIAFAQKRWRHVVDGDEWWVKQIGKQDRLICSQLVDEAYRSAGVSLFDDGRPSGLVSPGDLYRLAVASPVLK